MMQKDTLFLIPARGGSKGIPRKNIKLLHGKPLIHYSLEVASAVAGEDDEICVSTDDDEIIGSVEDFGLTVPFKRPEELATDVAGSYEVLQHAVNFYKQNHTLFHTLVLLQPTSPFRTAVQVKEAIEKFKLQENIEMVVSVTESDANPYYNLFEEKDGFLYQSKQGHFSRRQDCPSVYRFNGAIYVIRVDSLEKGPPKSFSRIRKYEMSKKSSLDLDDELDWRFAEFLLKEG